MSAVFDVMRRLIEHESTLEEQREFFDQFVHAGAVRFCTAIQATSGGTFYCAVASLALEFLAIEKEAFELHDA